METLEERYERLCRTPSSINQHLPKLRELACELNHVVEFGVDIGQSTTAFLASKVPYLTSIDIYIRPEIEDLYLDHQWAPTIWIIQKSSTLDIHSIGCDLLFIDTWHSYPQLKAELALHANSVDKYLVLHDTVSFKLKGEGWQDWEAQGKGELKGLWPAVEEFLEEHREWEIREHYDNNNGLTVLMRR